MHEVTITTQSPEETYQLAQTLGRFAQQGDTLLLQGTLGSGKTQFAKGMASGLDVDDEITSPTFTIVAEYHGRLPFVHMDLYRLYKNPEGVDVELFPNALEQIAFEDYLDKEACVLIEWPTAVTHLLDGYINLTFSHAPEMGVHTRQIMGTAMGRRAEQRLREWVDAWLS